MSDISDADLEGFLDEALSGEEMSRIERALRSSGELRRRLRELRQVRDAGSCSVGAVWRGHHLSCPTRDQLGSFLLDALDPELRDYIRFHLEVVACRFCQANVDELRGRQQVQVPALAKRRRRFFQSSVGHLSRPASGGG